jgi:hypothetical protein
MYCLMKLQCFCASVLHAISSDLVNEARTAVSEITVVIFRSSISMRASQCVLQFIDTLSRLNCPKRRPVHEFVLARVEMIGLIVFISQVFHVYISFCRALCLVLFVNS